MKKCILVFLLLLTSFKPGLAYDGAHRVNAELAGMFFGLGGGFGAGLGYEWAFHRRLALAIEAKYNTEMIALGRGPTHEAGFDLSIEGLLFAFDKRHFGNGLGLSVGAGSHYLRDLSKQDKHDPAKNYVIFPMVFSAYYQHVFENNWYIKTGFKGHWTMAYQPYRESADGAPAIMPKVFVAVGMLW